MIEIKKLYKSFNNVFVLENINLHVNKGEIISIIGESGAGKSTLIRCINLLEDPDSGDIYVDGKDILNGNEKISEVRRKIGMVFQTFNLFEHLSVIDNLTLAPIKLLKENKDEAKQNARILLNQVGLLNKQNSFPNELSGGQKQRVAIARCLAMKPKIILFDEPTSALDPLKVNEVLMIMRNLAKQGMTMIIVTHEMEFAKEISNRIIYMHNGKIWEEGTPEQIFNNPTKKETREFIYKESNFTCQVDKNDYDIYSLNSEIMDFFDKYGITNKIANNILNIIQSILNLIFDINNKLEIIISYSKENIDIKLEIISEGRKYLFQIPENFSYKRENNRNILETHFKITDRRKRYEEL